MGGCVNVWMRDDMVAAGFILRNPCFFLRNLLLKNFTKNSQFLHIFFTIMS